MKAQWCLEINSERLNNTRIRYLSHAKVMPAAVVMLLRPRLPAAVVMLLRPRLPAAVVMLLRPRLPAAFLFAAGIIKYSRIQKHVLSCLSITLKTE